MKVCTKTLLNFLIRWKRKYSPYSGCARAFPEWRPTETRTPGIHRGIRKLLAGCAHGVRACNTLPSRFMALRFIARSSSSELKVRARKMLIIKCRRVIVSQSSRSDWHDTFAESEQAKACKGISSSKQSARLFEERIGIHEHFKSPPVVGGATSYGLSELAIW